MNTDTAINTTKDAPSNSNPVFDLVEELGIELLSQEEQEELLGDMADALLESVLLHAVTLLSDEDRDALSVLVDRATSAEDSEDHQEAVLSFLKLKIPNFDDIVRAQAQDLKARYDAVRQEVEQGK